MNFQIGWAGLFVYTLAIETKTVKKGRIKLDGWTEENVNLRNLWWTFETDGGILIKSALYARLFWEDRHSNEISRYK